MLRALQLHIRLSATPAHTLLKEAWINAPQPVLETSSPLRGPHPRRSVPQVPTNHPSAHLRASRTRRATTPIWTERKFRPRAHPVCIRTRQARPPASRRITDIMHLNPPRQIRSLAQQEPISPLRVNLAAILPRRAAMLMNQPQPNQHPATRGPTNQMRGKQDA